jgi:hypothetical protein
MEKKIQKYHDYFEKIKPLVQQVLNKDGSINYPARNKGLQMIENIKNSLSPNKEIDKPILDIAGCWEDAFNDPKRLVLDFIKDYDVGLHISHRLQVSDNRHKRKI